MIFKLNGKKVAYYPIPKCGCTSVKAMIFYTNYGRLPNDKENVHINYPTIEGFIRQDLADYRFCLVRDPVERFISGYSNRVLHHGDIPFVEFDDFVNNFPKFYEVPAIRHHFRPQVDFIGRVPRYYTNIFMVHEMKKVSDFLSQIAGRPIPTPHRQTGGASMKPTPTKKQIENIEKIYMHDYKFLKEVHRAR